jgi:nitrate reductase NapAB chaperone NapD
MYLSGILVTTAPANLAGVVARLSALPGVGVYQTDAGRGRIVVVQEAATIDAETEGFTRIRVLEGVLAADLVYHWMGDAEPPPPPDLAHALARLDRIRPADASS